MNVRMVKATRTFTGDHVKNHSTFHRTSLTLLIAISLLSGCAKTADCESQEALDGIVSIVTKKVSEAAWGREMYSEMTSPNVSRARTVSYDTADDSFLCEAVYSAEFRGKTFDSIVAYSLQYSERDGGTMIIVHNADELKSKHMALAMIGSW